MTAAALLPPLAAVNGNARTLVTPIVTPIVTAEKQATAKEKRQAVTR